ncbi:hypothetical protein [Lysobacter sp. HA35]
MWTDQLRYAYRDFRDLVQGLRAHERTRELIGAALARSIAGDQHIARLSDAEFRVFSQFGDDGIIQWLVAQLPQLERTFVEFGVEDYSESNTRFLLINNGWHGLVMDRSTRDMARLRSRSWFWRCRLDTRAALITRDNIDALIATWLGHRALGLLHIDIDGNDYWVWQAIECTKPGIVIMEYNAVFGPERAVTIPYDDGFSRLAAHHSGQYFGTSIRALESLALQKGYTPIGTNSAGNNVYFVRDDLMVDAITRVRSEFCMDPCFRDSRNANGRLTYATLAEAQSSIRGLPVVNVITGSVEPF